MVDDDDDDDEFDYVGNWITLLHLGYPLWKVMSSNGQTLKLSFGLWVLSAVEEVIGLTVFCFCSLPNLIHDPKKVFDQCEWFLSILHSLC